MCLCVTEEDMTDPSQNTTKNIPVGCLLPVSGGGGDGGGGPLVTKFEQVSIRGYRMPLVEGTWRGPCMVRSHVLEGGDCRDRSLHGEFQCIMGNDPPLWTDKHD